MTANVLVLGHPFAPIGMGEQMRACVRALQAVGLAPKIYDVYRYAPRTDPSYRTLVDPLEATDTKAAVRIFHLNGDEVEPATKRLEKLGFDWQAGRNIICPAWELPSYPSSWAQQVDRFDEVWAISRFVEKSLRASVKKPVTYVGEAVERPMPSLLPRRYFGIRESSFVFLTSFDYSSYRRRKNPEGAIEAFRRFGEREPLADVRLVIKIGGKPKEDDPALAALADDPRVTLIDRQLDAREMMSLVAACDCFISLHRSEGFGRGPAEAMLLEKIVIATGYSGVLDYLDDSSALTVRFQLIQLLEDDYPHWQGQVWAEPHIEHATERLQEAWAKREELLEMRIKGRLNVVGRAGNRVVGLRMLDALNRVLG